MNWVFKGLFTSHRELIVTARYIAFESKLRVCAHTKNRAQYTLVHCRSRYLYMSAFSPSKLTHIYSSAYIFTQSKFPYGINKKSNNIFYNRVEKKNTHEKPTKIECVSLNRHARYWRWRRQRKHWQEIINVHSTHAENVYTTGEGCESQK